MDENVKLHNLLNARPTPPFAEGLAERIIARSHVEKQDQALGRAQIIRLKSRRAWPGFGYADIAQAFMIPRPAYAFALFLIFGVLLGFNLGTGDDSTIGDWSAMLSSGEGWL